MTKESAAAAAFCAKLAEDNCYPLCVPHPDGKRWIALMPLAYTCAIAVGSLFDPFTVTERWCYHTGRDAYQRLVDWLAARNGEGEPAGWHRHPSSGRRVSEDPDERDQDGKPVGAIGVLYVRG